LVALGGGAVVLTTQRGLTPIVPAVAAPLAVAWPRGAPALGAGVAVGALLLARPRRLPGPALLVAIGLAILIAIEGDSAIVRSGAAAVAVAVVTPAYVRTLEDLLLAGVGVGPASAGRAARAHAVASCERIHRRVSPPRRQRSRAARTPARDDAVGTTASLRARAARSGGRDDLRAARGGGAALAVRRSRGDELVVGGTAP